MAARLSAAAALWAHLPAAAAWDKDGHEAIGMTTMSALESGAVAQVKRLMGGRDAVDVAAWAHKVNKKYPWTQELHYQRQTSMKCKEADLSQCSENRCLVKALKHFYGRLVGKPMVDIDWPRGMKLTDADLVKFLVNLIGDLHQPLHFAGAGLGANVTVLFRGKKSSLFDIWDRELTQATMKDSPGFWWGGWTHVQRTRVEYEKDGAQWKKDGVVLFDRWADETARYLCDSIYRNPLTGKDLLEEVRDGVFRLEEELFNLWKREMLSKMLVAGARTAIVLNSVLQNRELGSLSGGTAVSGVVEESEEEEVPRAKVPRKGRVSDEHHAVHGKGPMQGPQAAMINFGIASVVVGVFMYVMRHWSNMDAVKQADWAKQRESGKKI